MLEERGPTEGSNAVVELSQASAAAAASSHHHCPRKAKVVVTNINMTLVLRDNLDPTNGMAVLLAVEKIDLPSFFD